MSGPNHNNITPMREDVPIIGQPMTIRAWWPSALLNCGCASKHALILQGIGAVTICPECKKAFRIDGVVVNPRTGETGLKVSHIILSQQPETPA